MLSSVDRLMLLRSVPMFRAVDVEALRVLAHACKEVSFERDARIFRQGEVGEHLYVIASGAVTIWQEGRDGKPIVLAELRARQVFGEIAVLDNGPRSASATASEPTELLSLSRQEFIDFGLSQPKTLLDVVRALSRLLRRETEIARQGQAKRE